MIRIAALICALAFCSYTQAAISVEKAVVGLDSYVRAEKWIPVALTIYNSGPDFRGTIDLTKGETVFRKSLHLASGTRKRVEMLYYHSTQYENLEYKILNEKNLPVLKNRLDTRILNHTDNLVLVISTGDYNHQFLNGQENPWGGKTFVAYLQPSEMYEERLAYSTADSIAVGSVSVAELSPSQWRALIQHIACGGVLVCSAATDLSFIRNPLLEKHWPEFTAELDQVSNGAFLVSEWARYSTQTLPPLAIAAQSLHAGNVHRELIPLNAGSSLATTSPYSKGTIIYFAFDYTRLPEAVGKPFSRVWNNTIYPSIPSFPPNFATPFRKRLEENPHVQKNLYSIPGLRLPDVKWFALFFFVYLCAIGPLQYLVLRGLKRNSLLWLSFPVIILAFTISAYSYSKVRQSGERKITHVAVIEVYPSLGYQTTYQVYGLALPESGKFRFQAVPANSYLRKFALQSLSYQPEAYELSEDLPRELQNEDLKSWTFRTFDAISEGPVEFDVTAKASISGKHLTGEIRNSSKFDLTDSFFLYDPKNSISFGTIPAGTVKQFELPLDSVTSVPFAELHLRDLLHLYNLSYSYPHFFFGRIPDGKGELLINGKRQQSQASRYVASYVDIQEGGPLNPWLAGSY